MVGKTKIAWLVKIYKLILSEGSRAKISGEFKIVGVLVGLILTWACFHFGFAFDPRWQSGKFSDYVAIMFMPVGTWPFWIFIVYSFICMMALFSSAEKSSRYIWVRIGLYNGVIVSLQYMFLMLLMQHDGEFLLFIFLIWLGGDLILILFMLGLRKLTNWLSWQRASIILSPIVVGIILVFHKIGYDALVFVLFWGPFGSFTIYLWLSIFVWKEANQSPAKLPAKIFGWIGWLSAYLVAWRIAVHSAMAYYATLPTEPPDCYIATAAARGHAALVKSENIVWGNGTVARINNQVRYLKGTELFFKTVFPNLHRLVRKTYDTIGPMAAKHCKTAFGADMAYLTLKPAEWFGILLLWVIGIKRKEVQKLIYRFGNEK